jgi:type IV pilus assembly protein PilP
MMRTLFITFGVSLLAASALSGQAPAAPATAQKTTAAPSPAPPVLEPNGYTYNPAGRRDPFISLVRRTTEAVGTSANPRAKGLAGLGLGEITMTGVVQGRDGYVALVRGADNKTYMVKPGDKLYDGRVRTITADAMFVLQDVNDPLSLAKQREVRKPLRRSQEAQ